MSDVRLRLSGVSRTYRGGAGVHGVDLDVAAGEIHALVGLNGAGKSTLMKLMVGMLRADAGTVEAGQQPIRIGALIKGVSLGHGAVCNSPSRSRLSSRTWTRDWPMKNSAGPSVCRATSACTASMVMPLAAATRATW